LLVGNLIESSLKQALNSLNLLIQDKKIIAATELAVATIASSFEADGKVLSCGNGGSMCDAMHFAEELTGRFSLDRRPLPAMAICDPAHLTCTANDFGYDQVFSRVVEAMGKNGDTLLVISTSGNSQNIINAVEVAKSAQMRVIALLGKDGGKLKDMVDIPLIVPSDRTDRIQEMHIKLIHIMLEGVERKLFPELYK
jgi:D-sedoheptulose 7-phosphate isomerase